MVAHKELFVLTHFRWPEVRICHETAELYLKYFQWISLLFCPSETEAEAVSAAGDSSRWHSSRRAPQGQGKSSATGQSTSNPRNPQSEGLSLPGSLQNWETESPSRWIKAPLGNFSLLWSDQGLPELWISTISNGIFQLGSLEGAAIPLQFNLFPKLCSATNPPLNLPQPSVLLCCQSANTGQNDGCCPFTKTEDNTPSLKVQEAHTNKSEKLNAEDCVGAWLISHNPTPKRAFVLPLPSNARKQLVLWLP